MTKNLGMKRNEKDNKSWGKVREYGNRGKMKKRRERQK